MNTHDNITMNAQQNITQHKLNKYTPRIHQRKQLMNKLTNNEQHKHTYIYIYIYTKKKTRNPKIHEHT